MNFNLPAMTGLRAMIEAGRKRTQALERLSTGLRINRASDGPSELVLSQQLTAQIAGVRQGIENLQNGARVVDVGDRALGEITHLLIRLQAIIVESSNGNLVTDDELDKLQDEVGSILHSVDRISRATRFADRELLNGLLRKTATLITSLSPTGAADVRVPPHGKIQPGFHRLVVAKTASVDLITTSSITGEQGRLTDEAGADTQARFNPAGDRVAYLNASGDIINRQARDTDLPPGSPAAIQVTGGAETGESQPQFGPGGTSILYQATTSGPAQVYRRNADGTGGATQIGFLSPNGNPAVNTAIDRVAFEAPYPNGLVTTSYAAPANNVTGVAAGPGGTLFALSDTGDAVYQFDALAGPGGAPVPLFNLPVGSYGDIAYDSGTARLYITEHFANPAPDVVRVYTTAGALLSTFNVGATVTSAVPPPNPNTADPGALSITTDVQVTNSTLVTTGETVTMAFTSTPTPSSSATYTLTGSVSGALGAGTFTSGAPINVGGVSFTLTENATAGTSVSGLPTVTSISRSHLFVSVNGAAPVEVTFPAGAPDGATIASTLQAQVPGITATFDGTRYTLTSTFQGANSSVVVTNGAPTSGSTTSAGGATFIPDDPGTSGFTTSNGGATFIADDGVSDQITVSVDGGAATLYDIAPAGDLTDGASIAAAIQTAVGGITVTFSGGNYTLTSNSTGASSSVVVTGPAGGAGDLLNLRAADGATSATGTDPIADRLTISVDGGAATPYDIAPAGDLTTGADIAAAIQAAVPGITATFSGGNYTITSNATGSSSGVSVTGPAGSAGDLLNLRAADGATAQNGYDNAAALLNLGAPNGGTEAGGTGVRSGDTFRYQITAVGDNADGLTFDGANLRVGDGTFNRAYRYSTAGVFDASYGVALGVNPASGIAYNAAAGTYYVIDTSGNFREVNATTGATVNTFQNPSTNGNNTGIAYDGTRVYISNSTDQRIYVIDPTQPHGTSIFSQTTAGASNTQLTTEPLSETRPDYSGNGSKIAYETTGGGISVRNADGTGPVQIVAAGGANPRLSFNGGFVAYEFGGALRIANAATGAVTDSFAGADARFSPDGTHFLYENGGAIEVASLNGSGQRTGPITVIAGASNGQFSPSNGGNRVVYESGGDVYVRFSDGTPVSPLRANDGTVLTILQLFTAPPSINTANTIVNETITMTLTTDNDGNDVWSVVGSASGVHANYDMSAGPYTSDTTAGGGGGLTFQLAPDGQYAAGDQVIYTVSEGPGASLDDGAFQRIHPNTTERMISGDGGTLDVAFGGFIPGPSGQDAILVSDGTQLQGGDAPEDTLGFSIENMGSVLLGLSRLDVRDPGSVQVSTGELFSAGLALSQQPTVTDEVTADHPETVVVSFTSPTAYDVIGSLTGVKSKNNSYVSGQAIDVEGVQFTLTGAAAAGNTMNYEIAQLPTLSRVKQAIRYVTQARSELGSFGQQLDTLTDVKSHAFENLTDSRSTLRDTDFAAAIGDKVRAEFLQGAAAKAFANALESSAQLLYLLAV